MGTRADFYVGRGPDAEWLGSVAMDGYPGGFDEPALFTATTEAEYREAVARELASRDDATLPGHGWPWPWKDSNTSDYAYAFDGGKVWGFSYGWFRREQGRARREEWAQRLPGHERPGERDAGAPVGIGFHRRQGTRRVTRHVDARRNKARDDRAGDPPLPPVRPPRAAAGGRAGDPAGGRRGAGEEEALSATVDLFRRSDATLSVCGQYRYSLTRSWEAGAGRVLWVMLNPSTADADTNDPTIRRCINFSRAWGHASLEVVNLFALRATDPRELRRVADPIGPENDRHILDAAARSDLIVGAWGNHGTLNGRAADVVRLVGVERLRCLATTAAGQPQHPLYMRADKLPVAFGTRP